MLTILPLEVYSDSLERKTMNPSQVQQIEGVEERLKTAMLKSDVSELDELLAPDLVFTNHLGQIIHKQDDLSAHRSGTFAIHEIDLSDQRIRIVGNIGIVTVHARIAGKWGDVLSETPLRFTRIWRQAQHGHWELITAHSSLVS